ncbi:hypothetical protein BGZ83_002708 [Gryganskiella cystojenkinii]|nr:hypothetical protein BGZ83_002708 [Gryganskiella cystojenkinii]
MSAIKLGFLAIRTVAKPIANSIKSYSVKHPKFKEACISFSHKTEMQLKMKFLGYKVESIRPLNDARAVEMGANFLSEAFIFGVAGSLIILENARTRMNARDRKNHVDDTLDNLLLITEELREELKQVEVTTSEKLQEMQKENIVLRKTLNEILDVSLRLRSHTPYSGQEIGIGNASGGFVLQIADEPMIRSFPADPSPRAGSGSTTSVPTDSSSSSSPISSSNSDRSSSKSSTTTSSTTPLQSSYDFHHQHHQLGHPEHQDEYILIDQQQTVLPPQPIKKSRWDISLPWSSSSGSSSSSASSA